MKILVFLGAPGSGKGTQASIIKEKLGIVHISTGDILRDAVAQKTEAGLKAKEYMDRGDLVPDNVMIDIIKDRISKSDCKNGFILDGFPRTLPQAEALDKMLNEKKMCISKVIFIDVSEDVLLKRLLGRRSCPKCKAIYNIYFSPPKKEGICDKCGAKLVQRSDDNEESVRNRLLKYRENTAPLIEYYKNKNLLVTIDGTGQVEKITRDILRVVN